MAKAETRQTAQKPRVAVIIVAAGRGSRFGGDLPKQYAPLAGETVLARTLGVFLAHPAIDHVQVVIHADDGVPYGESVAAMHSAKLLAAVTGGATRQASVLAGLEALAQMQPDSVLIHDAARPFVTPALIDRAILAAQEHGAAVPGAAVTDTIVAHADGVIKTPLDRAALCAVQTPQAFRFTLILEAHRAATAQQAVSDFTDDGSIAIAAGQQVHVFAGEAGNMKITTPEDLRLANLRLGKTMIARTASGYDVHAFGPGDHLWLCGIKVPHSRGFIAHSDGDVALHALTDALLGAMADGDIGRHFPPSDPQWKGAASDQFLNHAVTRLRQRGGILDLLDVTIIGEAPKIAPHAEAMRQRVADIAGVELECVSVKGTTTERLGFTGRSEGMAAMASVTIRLPDRS